MRQTSGTGNDVRWDWHARLRRLFTIVILVVIAVAEFPTDEFEYDRDFPAFYHAAVAVVRGGDIYTDKLGGYIYPPMLAVLMTPLAPLGIELASQAWYVINLGLIAWAIVLAQREISGRFGVERRPRLVWGVALTTVAVMAEPIRRELRHGQVDVLTLLAFLLALRWAERRPLVAGLIVGVASAIKYQSLIVLFYALIRGRWRMAGGCVAGLAVALLGPAAVVGWDRNLEFLSVAFGGIAQFVGLRDPEARVLPVKEITWLVSISIPSAMARGAAALGLGTAAYAAATAVIAGACGMLAWWMYRARSLAFFLGRFPDRAADARIVALEWIGLIVASVAFSPQTAKRHLFIVLPLVAAASLLAFGPASRAARTWLVGGIVVFTLGFLLPPRTATMTAASDYWRAVSGPSWCLLGLYFVTLAGGLSAVRRAGGPAWAPPR